MTASAEPTKMHFTRCTDGGFPTSWDLGILCLRRLKDLDRGSSRRAGAWFQRPARPHQGQAFLGGTARSAGNASPEAIQLMAELHAVHFLIIWTGAISAAKKRSDLETILSWMEQCLRTVDRPGGVYLPGDRVEVLKQ